MEELFKHQVFIKYFPYFAGLFFVVLFVSLGIWQLERAQQKITLLKKFDNSTLYEEVAKYEALKDFDRIKVSGKYLPEKQILIENMTQDGRLGYFVITPFKTLADESTLLVNRGWIGKPINPNDRPSISIGKEFRTVKGHVGHLPRVAIRSDPAFAHQDTWPRIGRYPSLSEIQIEIQIRALPTILLLSPDMEDGFVRRWQPNVSSPMTHYGYAFQWFALAVAAICVVGWIKKRKFNSRET